MNWTSWIHVLRYSAIRGRSPTFSLGRLSVGSAQTRDLRAGVAHHRLAFAVYLLPFFVIRIKLNRPGFGGGSNS
ncbi:hypothetical protein [Burkholderia pseudomallei]|uniref:hypothetical protein n=2 Tax=Pseudomonadota TaxID=1224 RepID=UPI001C4CAB84|nr:hypothetical protein [Burkholderia pseudomallei]